MEVELGCQHHGLDDDTNGRRRWPSDFKLAVLGIYICARTFTVCNERGGV